MADPTKYNEQLYNKLTRDVGVSLHEGLQDNSRSAYSSDENLWRRFCVEMRHPHDHYHIRYRGDKMLLFVQWRINNNAWKRGHPPARETVIRNIKGIHRMAIEKGYIPTDEIPRVTKKEDPRLWALIRSIEVTDDSKLPIRAKLLSEIIKKLNPNDLDDMIRITTFSISLVTIRRGTETTQEKRGGLMPAFIRWENGTEFPRDPMYGIDRTASIRFNSSKTNKTKKAQTALLYCRCKMSKAFKYPCGLCALLRLYQLQPYIRKYQPLNKMRNGKLYDIKKFRFDIQRLYHEATGLPGSNVGTHSLRSGGYQDALEEGTAERLIVAQAYWSSIKSAKPYEEKKKRAKMTYDQVDAEKMKYIKL